MNFARRKDSVLYILSNCSNRRCSSCGSRHNSLLHREYNREAPKFENESFAKIPYRFQSCCLSFAASRRYSRKK